MTLIYFILVLGITVLIHELGHFIFAKKAGVYIYEFSIGMGPCLFKWRRKNDETQYSIRLLPIGGYVQMAGEDLETRDDKISSDKQMCNKKWHERFLIIIAGILFNFILAIILLFVVGLVNGAPSNKPIISKIDKEYPIYETNLQEGDLITKINDKKISTTDRLILELQVSSGEKVSLEVKHQNGKKEKIVVKPILVEEGGQSGYKYGFSLDNNVDKSFIGAVKYGFTKTLSLLQQMIFIIFYLITGQLSLNSLAGPIGIFNIVGAAASEGFINVIYLIGYISVNVGFINLLPIPAFDGGRLLFLIIEKIKGKPINPKVENMIHSIGFILLMLLMIIISYNDIIRLFK